jgi:RNA recognition motif-containing protein
MNYAQYPSNGYGYQQQQQQQYQAFDPEEQAQIAQWQSAYATPEEQERMKRHMKSDKPYNANNIPIGARAQVGPTVEETKPKSEEDNKKTVIRKGGGQTWEDKSLLEWDPTHFRIMVGNLAGEVTDDSLAKAFAAYGVSKARVVRDKRTTKSKGFGFVSFFDGEQGFKAAREMTGKYIGSHPVTIQRSKTDVRPVTKKDNNKYRGKNGKNNRNNKDKDKAGKQDDPLRAHTGATIEKKPIKNMTGLKMLG